MANWKKIGRKIDKAVGGKKGWAALTANIPVVGTALSTGLTVASALEKEAKARGISVETVMNEKKEAAKQVVQTAEDMQAAGRLVKQSAPITVPLLIVAAVVVAVVVMRK